MKILAYSSLILGFVLIALGRPSTTHPNLPMCIIGAAMSIVGSILLCRSNMGNKATAKDKARPEETPRGFSIWRFLADILAGLGFIGFVSGLMYFFGLDSSGEFDWRGGIVCFVAAGILISPAYFVARHDRSSK